jgi:hypothetical protein
LFTVDVGGELRFNALTVALLVMADAICVFEGEEELVEFRPR